MNHVDGESNGMLEMVDWHLEHGLVRNAPTRNQSLCNSLSQLTLWKERIWMSSVVHSPSQGLDLRPRLRLLDLG